MFKSYISGSRQPGTLTQLAWLRRSVQRDHLHSPSLWYPPQKSAPGTSINECVNRQINGMNGWNMQFVNHLLNNIFSASLISLSLIKFYNFTIKTEFTMPNQHILRLFKKLTNLIKMLVSVLFFLLLYVWIKWFTTNRFEPCIVHRPTYKKTLLINKFLIS